MIQEIQVMQIKAGAERGPCPLGDDDLQLQVGANDFERLKEGLNQRSGLRIALVRTIQDDACHSGVFHSLEIELRPSLQVLPRYSHQTLRLPELHDALLHFSA
jgi:hypothetical protein